MPPTTTPRRAQIIGRGGKPQVAGLGQISGVHLKRAVLPRRKLGDPRRVDVKPDHRAPFAKLHRKG